MARIAGVPPARAGLLVRFAYRFAQRMFGKVPEPLTVAAHHPWIFRAYMSYEFGLGRARRVDARLKALAGLKGRRWSAARSESTSALPSAGRAA